MGVDRLRDGHRDDFGRPNPAIVAISRTLDAPPPQLVALRHLNL